MRVRGGCSAHEWERESCRVAPRKGTIGGGVGVRGYVVQDTYTLGCVSVCLSRADVWAGIYRYSCCGEGSGSCFSASQAENMKPISRTVSSGHSWPFPQRPTLHQPQGSASPCFRTGLAWPDRTDCNWEQGRQPEASPVQLTPRGPSQTLGPSFPIWAFSLSVTKPLCRAVACPR